jgi:hypothetical protein
MGMMRRFGTSFAGWWAPAALLLAVLAVVGLALAAATDLDAEARKGKRQGKGNKPTPTCFGLPATIKDHAGEITGTDGDDVIIGDAGPNQIFVNTGGDDVGVDRVCGGGGDDTISQECCQGTLFALGGPGDDVIRAGLGDAVLFGGDGDDELFGSLGSTVSVLVGDRGADTLLGAFGVQSSCQQDPGDIPVGC